MLQAMAQRSVPPRPHSASSFVWTPQWTVAACAMACMLFLTALWTGLGGDGHSAVRSLMGRDSGAYAAGGIPRLDCSGPTSNDVRRAWIEAARDVSPCFLAVLSLHSQGTRKLDIHAGLGLDPGSAAAHPVGDSQAGNSQQASSPEPLLLLVSLDYAVH